MAVGIRELKAHLSDYVSRAANGETVVVTERGKPVALLTPLPGRMSLERGAAEGWTVAPTALLSDRAPVAGPGPSVAEVLDEDRSP